MRDNLLNEDDETILVGGEEGTKNEKSITGM